MNTIANAEASKITANYEKERTEQKSKVTGKTIGNPELSEKAAKYYEELKKKYSNMDFILVSDEEKERAKAQAGNYANANRMVVLIDESKIEKMASDEKYREQYEKIISNAAKQLPELQSSLSNGTNANIKTFGMQVQDNGTASFFAVVDKSMTAQRERIAEKQAEKKAEKKAAEKKAAKEAAKERLEEQRADKAVDKSATQSTDKLTAEEDTIVITASSVEELLQKINDYNFNSLSDMVQTEAEKQIGQHIDIRG
jgi:hypothetical protein